MQGTSTVETYVISYNIGTAMFDLGVVTALLGIISIVRFFITRNRTAAIAKDAARSSERQKSNVTS